jgi:hypothetical protein
MPYMLLMVEPPGQRADRGVEAGQQVYGRMLDFAADLKARGLLLATESLSSDGEARVQVRNGRPRLIDGPFAEAKEMVGGFFLIDCDDRQEALAIAEQCPAAEWCTIEVRRTGPCWEDARPLRQGPTAS